MEKFSSKTLQFLVKAGKQKNPNWLDKNRAEYENVLQHPLQYFAQQLKTELSPLAPGYHFPQKGIGRMKYSANRVSERGGRLYKNWMTYSASRPRTSRFEHNPNLFFLINTDDPKDTILIAGGLYMPSSQQTRKLRETIAQDGSAFEKLFASKEFSRSFPNGFSDERISGRPTRGYDPEHPRMDWLRLQAFFVWKSYKRRDFASPQFSKLVARDFKQVLRLNEIMERALRGAPVHSTEKKKDEKPEVLLERLENIKNVERKMDF